jgi:hypothetical protein
MITCRKCGSAFSSYARIDGKPCMLGSRKYCLECSPYRAHNTKKIHEVENKGKALICERCGKEYIYARGLGCSLAHCTRCYMLLRRIKYKRRAVEYKGGKCSVCGYDKNITALEFHHREGADKAFGIANTLHSWEIHWIDFNDGF